MFLSGILGTILWIRSSRWFKGYKYPYRLLIRIIIQLCIVGLISILSTTIVFSIPRSYGDYSIFLPLSYPFVVTWHIDELLPVWPPYQYYSISVFGFYIEGGLLESEFGLSNAFLEEIFLHSILLFLLLNVVFTCALLFLSELWKFRNKRYIQIKT
jgi:hypothetical protein